MEKKIAKKTDTFAHYAPVGKAFCESKCDRKVIMTKDGPVIVCNGCMRVVMDNREN
jgi:hypothetical protein